MLDALGCSLPRGILHGASCSSASRFCSPGIVPHHHLQSLLALPLVFTAFHDQDVSQSLAAETLHCFSFKSMMKLGVGEQAAPIVRGAGVVVVRFLPRRSSVIRTVMRRCENWDGLKQRTAVKIAELCQGTEKVLHSKSNPPWARTSLYVWSGVSLCSRADRKGFSGPE